MTKFLVAAVLSLASRSLVASPCLSGSLQDYFNLGTTGCELGAVQVSDFFAATAGGSAIPLDPNTIQVIPGGTSFSPNLLFVYQSVSDGPLSAGPGQLLDSFFHFSVMGPQLIGASIALNSASAKGDGAVTGVLDVCPDGAFAGGVPVGCPTSPDAAVAFAIAGDALLKDSRAFAPSSFFDVFVDVAIDGGLTGSASLSSASVGIVASPEPSALIFTAAGFLAIGAMRLRRNL